MAQKAQKTLAASNARRLQQTLYATIAIHGIYWLLRALIFRSSFTRKSLILYIVLTSPQLFIHFQFTRIGAPTYTPDGSVRSSGSDLEAKGLTDYMWDVTYWTYGCILLAAVLGDWAWWAWGVMPVYSLYLAWTTYKGVRGGYTDVAGVPQPEAGTSKRQAKLEKRGGQRMQYR